MSKNASQASNYWPFLDFLRWTSALLVLVAHAANLCFIYIPFAERKGVFLNLVYFITNLGHEAVVVFFVLSGFLIGGNLTDSMRRGSFDLVRYLIARFTRIYIVYLPALIVTEAVFLFGTLVLSDTGDVPLFGRQQLDFGGVSRAICFLSGLQSFSCSVWSRNPILWSLGYEWALYLIAPAIIQLIVWKASPVIRLLAVSLVCAIVMTVSASPKRAVYLFGLWFLGAGSYRVFNSRLITVPLPAGLAGAGLIIAGMAIRCMNDEVEKTTDLIIAAGAAIAISCRPLVAFSLAPRFFGWAAGFSYTLYAIHWPFVLLIASVFRNMGFPPYVPSSPAGFMQFAVTVTVCLLASYFISLVTERKTGQVRAAMLRMCPPRVDRGEGKRG